MVSSQPSQRRSSEHELAVTSRQLRVMHLTVSDQGGAGAACVRLHRTLRELGVDSRVLVRRKFGSDDSVIQTRSRLHAAYRFRLDRLPLSFYRRKKVFVWWSTNWLHGAPGLTIDNWEPDLIHAHWIGDGYVPLEWLAERQKPVVWTMHDMWPFTGGCHYARDCERYETGCGMCPQLGSTRSLDLSSYSARRKTAAWSRVAGTVIAPSPWLGDLARRSAVLRNTRVEVIPYGLNGELFKPGSRSEARKKLGLPEGDRIILTGAVGAVNDERKGFGLLTDALRKCWAGGGTERWRLLVFGADAGPGLETLGLPVTYCGTVKVESELPRIYQAADVFALPSIQDNLPNTALEALGCGKPVVAFRSSGLAGVIQEGRTGWLATPFSTDSLAVAIRSAIESMYGEEWSQDCRAEFERTYAWPGPAESYLKLYDELLKQPFS